MKYLIVLLSAIFLLLSVGSASAESVKFFNDLKVEDLK